MHETPIYVADHLNYRIQKFDSNGNFLLKWGETGDWNSCDGDVALKAIYSLIHGNRNLNRLEESPS
jgi:DNA-binding beta-propeller fold protein YncE